LRTLAFCNFAQLIEPSLQNDLLFVVLQAITDFFCSKLCQAGQNQFSSVKAIPVKTKPTSSMPSHSSQAKIPKTRKLELSKRRNDQERDEE
jgi:hypothetical protein